MSITQPECVHL